jgi:hypothetical protein
MAKEMKNGKKDKDKLAKALRENLLRRKQLTRSKEQKKDDKDNKNT